MEKMTEAVTFKIGESGRRFISARSRSLGMEESEYIRHLIEMDYERAAEQFAALKSIFDAGESSHKVYRD